MLPLHPLIALLGPTACGKTKLAVRLAAAIDGEILSADSRQVYRGMDIGTGKDLSEYNLHGKSIPYHLIDLVDAGYKYNVFEYQRDFLNAWETVVQRGKQPILCGGTGLYLEAVLRGYKLLEVPADTELRERLSTRSLPELERLLSSFKTLHNSTDVDTLKRAIRAIEIETYYQDHPELSADYPRIPSIVFGLELDREIRRKRITDRLKARLDEGMVEEIRKLLERVSAEDLLYYGLEYKFVGQYVLGQLTYEDLFRQLEVAIHQFAKRQMTWFRGMERRGVTIHWLDAAEDPERLVEQLVEVVNRVG